MAACRCWLRELGARVPTSAPGRKRPGSSWSPAPWLDASPSSGREAVPDGGAGAATATCPEPAPVRERLFHGLRVPSQRPSLPLAPRGSVPGVGHSAPRARAARTGEACFSPRLSTENPDSGRRRSCPLGTPGARPARLVPSVPGSTPSSPLTPVYPLSLAPSVPSVPTHGPLVLSRPLLSPSDPTHPQLVSPAPADMAWLSSGLPAPGSWLSLRVCSVDTRPEAVPARLWVLPSPLPEEYERLSCDIQEGAEGTAGAVAGTPGELCLARDGRRWLRARVVARGTLDVRVFLLDEGSAATVAAAEGKLAPGRPEWFRLPPAALGCVLAGLAPPGGGADAGEPQRWAPAALALLGALRGHQLHGRVADVLPAQRLLLLEAPEVARELRALGLARPVPDGAFRALLQRHLGAAGAASPPAPRAPPRPLAPAPALEYFYPQLQPGVTEPVVVTQVCHPQRVHCQLRSLSREIHRLSESMAQAYGGPPGTGDRDDPPAAWGAREGFPSAPGAPCAACGLDGRWYRALLLETFPARRCAQVLHVDYGRKELASRRSLRPLRPEHLRMPVVTFPCALCGLCDGGTGWSRSQVGELKALVLGRAVSAKIEFYCSFERVYYVTLYGEDGLNLNREFGAPSGCLADRFLQGQGGEEDGGGDGEKEELAAGRPGLRPIALNVSSRYDAQVEVVRSPSEFWIRLGQHSGAFRRLARSMGSFYSAAGPLEGLLPEPRPQDLCCVRWGESGYYRAVVTKVEGESAEVFLADRGNSERVGLAGLRRLPPQFRRLPGLALRCRLADVQPLEEAWSPEATSLFAESVLHKELAVRVAQRLAREYVVELLDESRAGEGNIGKVLAQAGHARYQGPETWGGWEAPAHSPGHLSNPFPAHKNTVSPAKKVEERRVQTPEPVAPYLPAAVADTRPAHVAPRGGPQEKEEKGLSSCSPLRQDSSCRERLKAGTTVEVRVSHVESPGRFWCQLTRDTQELRMLMCRIEDHCNTAATPYLGPTPACLAKRTASGQWSRALVSGPQSAEHIRVTFVDYGDKELVPTKDIYSMGDEFLQVRAQAFRCSLYNLIQPTGDDPFVWDEKATQAFGEFVGNTQQNSLELKCTVFALASMHEEQFTMVDLLTPFQSACHFLIEKGLARPVKLQSPLEPSIELHSYYYSTHHMKTGSEEPVYVTHVDDPWTFYCQLAKNTAVLQQLSRSVTQLSRVVPKVQTPSLAVETLCLAKYTDGNWYRGIVIAKDPSKVFFVDFGNTCVTSDNLVPIPRDAYEVLLLPMQAVKCSLSDIPNQMPEQVVAWFREAVLDKPLKALVVAKEPDGTLVIELYDDSRQINASINEKLGLLGHRAKTRDPKQEGEAPAPEAAAGTPEQKSEHVPQSPAGYLSKSGDSPSRALGIWGESWRPKTSPVSKELKPGSTKMSSVPLHPCSLGSESDPVFPFPEQKEEIFDEPPLKATQLEASLPERRLGDLHNKDLPLKFCDFPRKNIAPGFKTTVYVSHVNDLLDFYVQLTADEAELNHLSERLNVTQSSPQRHTGPWEEGDVICAVFPEDSLWYRAVVKGQQPDGLLCVHFLDYGNVAMVHRDNTGRLDLGQALSPCLCVHCSLQGLWVPDIVKSKEVRDYFSQRTGEAQITCEFVKFQDRWEVILADDSGIIAEDVISRYTFSKKSQLGLPTQVTKGECAASAGKSDTDTSVLLNWHNPQMKTVRAYATMVTGPEYFWCQLANREKLQYLEVSVQTAGRQIIDWRDSVRCPRVGEPCIVKCRGDGHYYRALITSICEDHLLSVRLVDFGNVEDRVDPKALWNIPSELLSVPMQAFPCCLSGFNVSEGACPPQGNDYFYEIVTDGVLEVTILEIKRDICGVPLAVVDLKSKGENITEKMKMYSRMAVAKSHLPYGHDGPEMKGARGFPRPKAGLGRLRNQAGPLPGQTFSVDPEIEELAELIKKDFNLLETKASKSCDLGSDVVFEAFGSPCGDGIGPEVLHGTEDGHLVDQEKFDTTFRLTGLSALLPPATEAADLFELGTLEVPLSPDEGPGEFLELDSAVELECSVGGEEEDTEDLGPGPLPGRGRDIEVALPPFAMPALLSCEEDAQSECHLPTALLAPGDQDGPFPVRGSQTSQWPQGSADPAKLAAGERSGDQRGVLPPLHEKNRDPQIPTGMGTPGEELPEGGDGPAASSLVPSLSEKESGKRENFTAAWPARASAQAQGTHAQGGLTAVSPCAVGSRLGSTWPEREALETTEDDPQVLNLSDGLEETMGPEDEGDGTATRGRSPTQSGFPALSGTGVLFDAVPEALPWSPGQKCLGVHTVSPAALRACVSCLRGGQLGLLLPADRRSLPVPRVSR
ncbi:tudor domain-containing protein 6 [Ctenodactylus gundi]